MRLYSNPHRLIAKIIQHKEIKNNILFNKPTSSLIIKDLLQLRNYHKIYWINLTLLELMIYLAIDLKKRLTFK